jgi:hypothetical protein
MNYTIDLAARYAAAFGMMAVGKQIDKAFIDKSENNDYKFDYYPVQSSDIEYVKMEVPGLEALEFSSILSGDKAKIFAPPLMMSFSQEKSLIETEVNDDDPIVIERWGTKPWDISIKGVLIDLENRIYPSDEIRRLNQNWKYNGVIKVIGKQFEEKDIDTIYFKSIDFSGVEGYQDTIQFSIEASSIKGVNFTLLKPKRTGSVEVGNVVITNIEQ